MIIPLIPELEPMRIGTKSRFILKNPDPIGPVTGIGGETKLFLDKAGRVFLMSTPDVFQKTLLIPS